MNDRVSELFHRVSRCHLCHGAGGILVPTPASTPSPDVSPRVLLLGEQPAPIACRETRVTGLDQDDPDLARLRDFLNVADLDPGDVFYATAVFCLPLDETARGARPTAKEMRNCTRHVESLLKVLRPQVLVPLGHTSIQVIQWIYDDWKELRQFILNYDIGNSLERNGITVYPLYHTSAATLRARSQDRQNRDWRQLGALVESLGTQSAR